MKKIIIVGGGISGLASGIYARKACYEVEIYEKNAIAGGECTGWDRNSYHIDNCIHWLMGTNGNTDLNKIWHETGVIGEGVKVHHFDKMYTSELNGQSLTLWSDLEKTRQEMLALSPEDADEINDLMDACKLCEKVQIPADKAPELMSFRDIRKMGKTMKDTMSIFRKYKGLDTNDLMSRFKHPLIRCLLSDFCPKDSMATSFPMAYGNFTSGDGGIPQGGSRAVAQRMKTRFESLGGKIFCNTSVEKINIKGQKAVSALLSNGTEVKADYFICSCDPDYTFNHLLSPKYMGKIFKEVYSKPDIYPVYGMFQVAYSVDCEEDALNGDVILDCGEISSLIGDFASDRLTVKTFSYEPSFAPDGKQILQVMLGMTEKGYDYWLNLYSDKEKYNSKKKEFAALFLDKIEKRYPEYADKMSVLDVWTPITYKRYCNAYKGYNQAFTPTKHANGKAYPSAWMKCLKNVVLSGQWLSAPGGLPGAAIQGKYAVQRIDSQQKVTFNINTSMTILCFSLITFLIALFSCRINPEIEYGWLSGLFHGFFAPWNYLISIFGDRIAFAPIHTQYYTFTWWLAVVIFAWNFIKGFFPKRNY